MSYQSNTRSTAFLMSDATRWTMLIALLDGRALPAGELAYAAGVSAQTASSQLAKLRDGGLIGMEKQGRHRYFRLSGAHVAQAIEQLATIQPRVQPRRKPLSPQALRLRHARTCYDHLAGRLGVALAQGLEQRGYIVAVPDKQYDVSTAGADWFAGIGLDVTTIRPTRRGLARQCLDWTERRHHLAGPLGVRLLQILCTNGWLRRSPDSRAVQPTLLGRTQLKRQLGVDDQALQRS